MEDEIKFRKKSDKAPLFGVLFILIAVCGYVFFVRGVGTNVADLRASVVSQEGQLSELMEQVAGFESAEKEYGVSTEVERRESLKYIPAGMEQDEVIRDLVEISEVYDIILNSISFGDGATDKDGINALSINASFEGNYSDLISFLKGIEQNSRVLKVNSINVQVSKVDVFDIDRVTFSLSMEAYYQEK